MPCMNDTISINLDERDFRFWDIFVNIRLTEFVIVYGSLFTFSVAINVCLLYLALRHRHLRHPQDIILANLAVCDILIAIIPSVHLLPSVVEGKTVILSKWCISFVPVFGNFMIACQLTWTLLAAERYTFICKGIHYLLIATTRHIRWALAVIWTIVLFLNIYHQVVIHLKFDFAERPLDTLMCDPLTLKNITELSYTDLWLLCGPPGCMIVLSVISIFTCYFRIFEAARKVALDLRRSYRRAALRVSCYLVMCLVQMLTLFSWMVLSVFDSVHPAIIPQTQSQLVLLIIMMATPSANALTAIYYNKVLKEALLPRCCLKVKCEVGPEPRGPEELEMRELQLPQIQGRACESNEP